MLRRRMNHLGLAEIVGTLMLVLIVVAAGRTLAAVYVPWLWIGLLAVGVLYATGTIGHSRSSQDR
ncbi:MAG: hypothetical protein ACLPZM_08755 [Thermoplasmata archaeon]